MPRWEQPKVGRGQRIIREVTFEPDPELAARVRFVAKPAGPLPPDEHSAASDRGTIPPIEPVTDTAVVADSPSVWEAREEDDDEA